jgi:predicted transcriptional regulator YdeE
MSLLTAISSEAVISEPQFIHVPAFLVSGITVRTLNRDEANSETAKLPGLWSRFFSEALAAEIPHALSDSPIYGIYHDYESDYRARFSVTAGVGVSAPADGTGFDTVQVPAASYLAFAGKGLMPNVVIETWQSVWHFFEISSQYKRKYTVDFELYSGADEVAIHIAV